MSTHVQSLVIKPKHLKPQVFFKMLKSSNNLPQIKILTIVKVSYAALINQYFSITCV